MARTSSAGFLFQRYRWPLFAGALAVLVLCAAAFLFWGNRHGPDVRFAQRQKVSTNSALYMSFPEPMDHKSVQESLSMVEKVEGTYDWKDEVLVFTPSAPLKAAATYTFVLASTAKTAEGLPLGRNLEFVFTVAGPPVVAAQIPLPDAVRVSSGSRITIIFDRPMIPLMQVQGDVTKDTIRDWPVTIVPDTPGRWRWISTVAREFIPAKPLQEGTTYTVTVPKGITSVIGDATAQDFRWSFETLRPELLSTDPQSGSIASGPTTLITLTFNRRMDLQSAKDLIALYRVPQTPAPVPSVNQKKGTETVPFKGQGISPSLPTSKPPSGDKLTLTDIRYGTIRDEKAQKNLPVFEQLVLVPAEPLAFNTAYTVYGAPGVRGTMGSLGTQSGFLLNFQTVGDLKAVKGEYLKDELSISIQFNNPMDGDTLDKGIAISPKVTPPEGNAALWTVTDWNGAMQVRAYPQLQPSTTYTVTVGTSAKDKYGQSLKEPFVFSFTTPSETPRVFINSRGGSEFGIFEQGKPPVYYLNAMNVSRLNLEFARLTLPDFLSIRSQAQASYDFVPNLAGKEMYRTWNLTPTAKKDQWGVTEFDMAKQVGSSRSGPESPSGPRTAGSGGTSLRPGIYALFLRAPEYVNAWNNTPGVSRQYFAITNLAVTLKYSGSRALVWVTNMQTGDAVKSARVVVHSLDGREVRSGTTDAQGFFETELPSQELISGSNTWEPEFWVTAETADDFAFVSNSWNEGIRPYNFDFIQDFRYASAPTYKLDSYIYTERPVYRAGDTVHFKGILRQRDWEGTYSIPSDKKVLVTMNDANGNEVYKKTLDISPFGSFTGDFPTDAKAVLGEYGIMVALVPDADVMGGAYGRFSLLAYRKPEYKVTVTPEATDYFDRQTVKATITGEYYFGAPMSNAKVAWRATTTDYYFNKYTDGWYAFSTEDTWCWWECQRNTAMLTEGEGTLDAAGRLDISIPVNLEDKALSQVLTIEADITDANNQVVSNRESVYVHKANAYVGIRTDDYVVQPGAQASVQLVTVKPDGTALSSQNVKLSVYSRTWNTIKKKGVDGEYYEENEPKDTFVKQYTATTAEDGKGRASVTIPSGGEYRIVAEVSDGQGRVAKAGASVYGWSSSYVNWPRSNNDRMDVIADKPEYKVGDTAKILVKSPYQGKGVKALVTVEREGIISKQVVDITSNAQSFSIPITEHFVPNAYISVVVLKPRVGETFNENGLDTGSPAFKVGYAKLLVDIASKKLDVAIATDKTQYGPGEKVTVTLTTKDASGKPVPAELSLGVVDMSVLALSSFETPDLARLFYAERGLGVYTSQMLSMLLERFKPGSKGGGGGNPETRARGNFLDTAYWNPGIVTDKNGRATVSFSLPDNLTTWQLLAVGSTKQHTFGSFAATTLETKKVIVRPVRPRFAVQGDSVTIGAIVHNFLPDTKTFTVTLAGSGFTAAKLSQKVEVKAGAQAKLNFPVTIRMGNQVVLRLTAQTDGALDEVVESFPAYAYTAPQSVATTGVTDKVALEKVIVPSLKDAPDGTLSVAVSPSLAAYLPKALNYLVQDPYGCAEQTMSSFLPSVVLARLQAQGAVTLSKAELDDVVTTGLQRIYTFQRSDGGFGYFDSSDRSYPPLTAYILEGLAITKQSGYAVDQGVMDRAAKYLDGVLRMQDQKNPMDLTERAGILLALSEAGRGDVSLLNNLAEKRTLLPIFARSQLALAYAKTAPKSGKASEITKELINFARVDSRGTHFEEDDDAQWGSFMNTTQRTTALVLRALLQTDADNALLPNVTRYLLAVRSDGHWDTTQSTVAALFALSDYLDHTGELNASYNAGVFINGMRGLDWDVAKGQVRDRKEVVIALDQLNRSKENEVKVGLEGTGRLYYDLLLHYQYAGETIEPAEEGISVTRNIRPFNGKGDASRPKLGETYVVTLTITVPQERHFVAVESPVPAGMEIVDLALETSQKNLLSQALNRSEAPGSGQADDSAGDRWWWDPAYWASGLWRFSHHEVRDDQYFLFAESLPAGVYQYQYVVRATTPGTFHQRPTRAYEMYFPETFGQTEGRLVTIGE